MGSERIRCAGVSDSQESQEWQTETYGVAVWGWKMSGGCPEDAANDAGNQAGIGRRDFRTDRLPDWQQFSQLL